MLTLNLSHSKHNVLYTNRILFKRFRYQFASKRAIKVYRYRIFFIFNIIRVIIYKLKY